MSLKPQMSADALVDQAERKIAAILHALDVALLAHGEALKAVYTSIPDEDEDKPIRVEIMTRDAPDDSTDDEA